MTFDDDLGGRSDIFAVDVSKIAPSLGRSLL